MGCETNTPEAGFVNISGNKQGEERCFFAVIRGRKEGRKAAIRNRRTFFAGFFSHKSFSHILKGKVSAGKKGKISIKCSKFPRFFYVGDQWVPIKTRDLAQNIEQYKSGKTKGGSNTIFLAKRKRRASHAMRQQRVAIFTSKKKGGFVLLPAERASLTQISHILLKKKGVGRKK